VYPPLVFFFTFGQYLYMVPAAAVYVYPPPPSHVIPGNMPTRFGRRGWYADGSLWIIIRKLIELTETEALKHK
jgi:hypothetical protein